MTLIHDGLFGECEFKHYYEQRLINLYLSFCFFAELIITILNTKIKCAYTNPQRIEIFYYATKIQYLIIYV